jgi:hypothetical protein
MSALPPMDAVAAGRFLAEQPYAKRFSLCLYNRKGGSTSVPVLSADEMVRLGRAVMTVLLADIVAPWISTRLGDDDLAAAIIKACDGVAPFKQTPIIVDLMSERREQALDVLRARAVAE